MGNTLLSDETGHSQNTHYWKDFLCNLILPLRVWPHVLSPVSSKCVEATGHCGLPVSSTVENISSSRLVFSCGVGCFLCGFNILFWGTFPCYCYSWYFRLNNAFTFVLLSRGETSQIFSLAAKQQLKIAGWSWVGKCLWACCWPVILRRWTDKNCVCVFLHSSNNQTRSVDIKSVKPANLPCSVTGKSYSHWNNLVMVRPEEVKLWLCFW